EPAEAIHGTASPTAAAGAKLAQVVEVTREHLAVAAADPVGLREMLEVVNGFVELAGVELPAGPFRLEFLETARDFGEVVDLMAVEAGAARGLVEIGPEAGDAEALATGGPVPGSRRLMQGTGP